MRQVSRSFGAETSVWRADPAAGLRVGAAARFAGETLKKATGDA